MEELNQPPSQDTLPNTTESNSGNDNDKINRQHIITFVAAFLGWTLDSFDFFTVILSVPYIAKEFQMEPSVITGR